MSAVVGADVSLPEAGPIEERYRQPAAFRAASYQTRVTPTHIHIAVANGLGWGFDGMDGVIFALASPLVIGDFGLSIPDYRSGMQIALLVGIIGMFAWPWMADRYGRRTLLALNIALFSLMMPVLAICTTWAAFVAVRCVVNFALNGEWSLGSMLVAETWPARLRGRAIGINRGTWCFGAALAGVVATFIIAVFGWRFAFAVPAVLALFAVYVRAKCPESPYWVRMQDRKARIARPGSGAGKALFSSVVYRSEVRSGDDPQYGGLRNHHTSMILTAEVYPTRIRGIGNGFSWSVPWVFGFVLWPFLAVGLQQRTGSFAAAFLLIPVAMACMALGVWWFIPEHAGKELDHIAT